MQKANPLHQRIQHHCASQHLEDSILPALTPAGKHLRHPKLEDFTQTEPVKPHN